jgi:hypothetical protein
MRAFHGGGAYSRDTDAVNGFKRYEQLTMLPSTIPNQSVLAREAGKVTKIEEDATGVRIHVGQQVHHVAKDANGVALHRPLEGASVKRSNVPWAGIHVGTHVDVGQQLSDPNRTAINMRDLYETTGSLERTQNQMTNEFHGLYAAEGVQRRNIETIVKAMTRYTEVQDPGDHPDLIRGDIRTTSQIQRINQMDLKGKKPIVHTPILTGLGTLPNKVSEDWMATMQHRNLAATVAEAAATGAHAHIHGSNPLTGLAYSKELGLTSEHANQPGLGHLRDVAKHHY